MARKATKPTPPTLSRSSLLFLLVAAAVAAGFGLIWLRPKSDRNLPSSPNATSFRLPDQKQVYAAYGGSTSCRECHEEAFAAWAKSHHALAERQPTNTLDHEAFVPTRTFHHGSQQTTLRANEGRYEAITTGLHGTNEIFHVQRMLAENPLRQILIAFPGGRLQASEAAWDPRSNEWFNVYGNEDRKPGEWGHWTGRGMNWNSMCATCHNTRVRKNYDVTKDTFDTAMVETGVGCESCHGPMENHNDWQYANKGKGLKDPTIHKLSRDQMFDTCAACHSRRAEITGDPKPGDSFFDHHLLSIVDDSDLFYPDGQIRDEDYEVTAFMGSRMFHKGVRCVDCHDVHTMKPKLPGNLLCLSCHGAGSTNAPVINPVTHSHHKVFGFDTNGVMVNTDLTAYKPAVIKEAGGECVNCHMPQTTYMQRHKRHDHGFTIPDPLLTKEFAIPNACERCHADKGTDWNLRYVEQWYGEKMNRPYRLHAQMVAKARQGDPAARELLVRQLTTDEIAYWQAVAANLLQPWAGEPAVKTALIQQLKHTNALVRQMAMEALAPLAQADEPNAVAALTPLLRDPSRNVRVESARALSATLDTNSLPGSEYLHVLTTVADQPLGQMQAGHFYAVRNDSTNALRHFERAVEWDPYSAGLRHELAIVLSQQGRSGDAVKQLEAAVRLQPNEAEFHYKLALALNETGDTARVITELERAVKCDARHARAWYNLGLARSGQGDAHGSVEALLHAESIEPSDARIPYARATILARLGQVNEARQAARRALEINPSFTDAADLLRNLNNR